VQCLAQPRAGDWRLRGRLRSEDGARPAAPAELLLSGVRPTASAQILPSRLHELRVQGLVSGPGLQLQAREGSYSLEPEAVRLHHDPAGSFYQALPRVGLPRRTRVAWAALLTLLRVPLVSRLLK